MSIVATKTLTTDVDTAAKLMLQFQGGDDACFEAIVDMHKQNMFDLAYRFLGNYQDAEDVTQELFIKVYHSRETYRALSKFTTWIYKICKNTCIKQLQKRKANTTSLSDYQSSLNDRSLDEVRDPKSDLPLDSLLAQEKAETVKNAIDSLPERQRLALVLYRYQECSYQEVSEILDCSEEAVKSILHRARMSLKDKLKVYLKRHD